MEMPGGGGGGGGDDNNGGGGGLPPGWGRGPGRGPRRGPSRPPDITVLIRKSGDFFNNLKKNAPAFGLAIVVVVVLFIGFGSFYTVAPEEIGVVKRFGRMVRTTTPGPHLKIPFVETVLKPQVTKVHRIEVGFKTIDPGPPARYSSIKKEALMLTGDENIVAVEFIVQFKIKDATAFLFNIRSQAKAIKDASEAAMREVVGKTPIDEVLTEGRFRVQQETKRLLQDILDGYDSGISIVAVQLQDVLPPGQVADAFKDVASAREDRERAVEQAEGYRNDLIPKAKGEAEQIVHEAQAYKEARINEAKGDVSRFLQVLKEYRRAKDVTRKRIYIETMEEVLARMEKVILEGAAERNVLPYLPLKRERPAQSKGGRR